MELGLVFRNEQPGHSRGDLSAALVSPTRQHYSCRPLTGHSESQDYQITRLVASVARCHPISCRGGAIPGGWGGAREEFAKMLSSFRRGWAPLLNPLHVVDVAPKACSKASCDDAGRDATPHTV